MDLADLAARTDDLMRIGLGGLLLAAAAMKAIDPTPWAAYVPGWFTAIVPLDPVMLMHLAGVAEAGLGIALLVRYRPAVVAGLSAAYLASITVAVASIGVLDVALRDLGLVIFAAAVALNEYRLD